MLMLGGEPEQRLDVGVVRMVRTSRLMRAMRLPDSRDGVADVLPLRPKSKPGVPECIWNERECPPDYLEVRAF